MSRSTKTLLDARGSSPDLTLDGKHARCSAHHPESWWYQDKRCDRRASHGGPHHFHPRTMYGVDTSILYAWKDAP